MFESQLSRWLSLKITRRAHGRDSDDHEDPGLPLERYAILRTQDIEETRARISEVFCDHRFRVSGRHTRLDARQHAVRLRDTVLTYTAYGADALVDVPELPFYVVQIPIRGSLVVDSQGLRFRSDPSLGSVPSYGTSLSMWLSADCEQLIWRIEPAIVSRLLSHMINAEIEPRVRFHPNLPIDDPRRRAWVALVKSLVTELSRDPGLATDPSLIDAAERLLVHELLLAQPHNYTTFLLDEFAAPAASHVVTAAADRMRTNPERYVTVTEVAREVGVGLPTLDKGFRVHLDTTAVAVLETARLRRVRQALLDSDPLVPPAVARLLRRHGVVDLATFTNRYVRQYGETPTATTYRR